MINKIFKINKSNLKTRHVSNSSIDDITNNIIYVYYKDIILAEAFYNENTKLVHIFLSNEFFYDTFIEFEVDYFLEDNSFMWGSLSPIHGKIKEKLYNIIDSTSSKKIKNRVGKLSLKEYKKYYLLYGLS